LTHLALSANPFPAKDFPFEAGFFGVTSRRRSAADGDEFNDGGNQT
jgi:hypothetical protein